MSTQIQKVIDLLEHIAKQMDQLVGQNQPKKPRRSEDERVALAVVAIARGASTYQEVAKALGVTRGTVSRNPGIRRAMEAAIRDRRPADKEAAEEYQWHQ